jgi:hypothetical protein
MMFKRFALFAAAAALPLTALGAAPAQAAVQSSSSSEDPAIHIKKVNYDDDYFSVKVKYRCYSEDYQDDDYGYLYVSLTQKHASYEGWNHEAECDGYWHHEWVYAYNTDDHVGLKSGKLWVDAEVTDPDGHSDSDHQVYKIKFHDHH